MKTLIELFESSVERFPDNPLLWEKTGDKYISSTYLEIHQKVKLLAAGLLASGLSKGDRVGLLSEGRNSWLISELAVFYCGAINVPLSVKLEAPELRFRLDHSGSKMVIVSKAQSNKILEVIDTLTGIERVIHLDEISNPSPKNTTFIK